MKCPAPQCLLIDEDLQRLGARVPGTPATEVLLCRLIMQIGREMTSMFERQVMPYGFREAEFRVLTTLFSQLNGAAHSGELCLLTLQSPTNLSRISDALVDRGLVTRFVSIKDRRQRVLQITEKGDELVRDLLPKLVASLREMLLGFSEAEQRDITAMLRHVGGQLTKVGVFERG